MTAPLKFTGFYVQTEGDNFIHEQGQASSSEKIYLYAQLHAEDTTGPFSLQFWLDSGEHSGSTHTSMYAGETDEMWFQCGPLHEGHYQLSVTCTAENHEWDPVAGSISVEVLPARRGAIVDDTEGSHGWHLGNVQFQANNFLGRPMTGDRFYLRLVETSGRESAHDGTVEDGVFSLSQVWVPASGTMVLSIWANQAGEYVKLERSKSFQLSGQAMVFEVDQEFQDVEVTAKDETSAAHKAGAKGTAGLDWKIVKVGGEISTEDTDTHTTGTQTKFTVRVPRESLKITQTH